MLAHLHRSNPPPCAAGCNPNSGTGNARSESSRQGSRGSLRGASSTSSQQVGHRGEVSHVAFETSFPLPRAGFSHRCGVEFNHLQTPATKTRHQGAVIAARRLDLDPNHHSSTPRLGPQDSPQQGRHSTLSELETERVDNNLTEQVSHKSHRSGLPHIDRNQQTPLRINPTHLLDEQRLSISTNKPHPTPPRSTATTTPLTVRFHRNPRCINRQSALEFLLAGVIEPIASAVAYALYLLRPATAKTWLEEPEENSGFCRENKYSTGR